MTDRLTHDRLAELRRIAAGEDWSPPTPEDLGALLGEIDRLTDELGLVTAERDHLRDTQLQWIARDAAKMAARAQEFSQKATRIATLAASLPQGAPQPGADSPRAASVANETSGPEFVAQRPAEGFEVWEWAESVSWNAPGTVKIPISRGDVDGDVVMDQQQASVLADMLHDTAQPDDAEIAPEDEGISSADAQAQIESDRYMDATVDCPDCDAYGRTRDEHGTLTAQPCPTCGGTGRVPDLARPVANGESDR